LLRTRRERQRNSRTTQDTEKFPPLHVRPSLSASLKSATSAVPPFRIDEAARQFRARKRQSVGLVSKLQPQVIL
jgi:hypothetical protein